MKVTVNVTPPEPLSDIERLAAACRFLTATQIRRLCISNEAKEICKVLNLGAFKRESDAANAIESHFKQ